MKKTIRLSTSIDAQNNLAGAIITPTKLLKTNLLN